MTPRELQSDKKTELPKLSKHGLVSMQRPFRCTLGTETTKTPFAESQLVMGGVEVAGFSLAGLTRILGSLPAASDLTCLVYLLLLS